MVGVRHEAAVREHAVIADLHELGGRHHDPDVQERPLADPDPRVIGAVSQTCGSNSVPSPISSRPSRSASSTFPWSGQRANARRRASSRWMLQPVPGQRVALVPAPLLPPQSSVLHRRSLPDMAPPNGSNPHRLALFERGGVGSVMDPVCDGVVLPRGGRTAKRRPSIPHCSTWQVSSTVLYDPDCGFCRVSLALLLRWDTRRRLRPVALGTEEADALLDGMSEDERMALVAPGRGRAPCTPEGRPSDRLRPPAGRRAVCAGERALSPRLGPCLSLGC